ncbi:Myosin rod fragments domain-containing protein [Dioscorea alata]|uniref:Myosin rods domain-containing protein n=1 Tax=Dioscorea alata TaxID=55571 RepID=A0ACB7UNJ3_DIOAL|nr:Myosin rod fragments domain-containing protein [Dioscorea alata]
MVQSSVGPLIPAKTIAQTPDPSYHAAAKKRRQKRLRSSVLPGGGAYAGRRSGPGTPLLRWKFDNGDRQGEVAPEVGGKGRRKKKSCDGAPAVSARRLAAGIWQLHLPEFASGGGEGRRGQVVSEHFPGHMQNKSVPIHGSAAFHACGRNELLSPMSVHNTENFMLQKLDGSAALANSVMEKATKWDPGCTKASDEVYRFYSHLKLLEDQQITTVSVVSTLQAELEQARTQIAELEAERKVAKKKIDHFFRKVEEEKASWRSKEHKKIRAILDDMKIDLNRERKSRQRMEIMNSKLVNELAEAKLSAKRFMQDYEKERKNRILMEEVCDELAKEMGEDKAEVDALKKESLMAREEVEEERKMLQMAEIWREERVQMKLVDAKLTLEEKYAQLSKLQADLEAFLKERRNTNLDEGNIKEADALVKAVGSVGIQDIKELTYQPPPASEDIFSVFEELQPREDANEIEIQPCCESNPASHASKVHTVSPDINGLLGKTKYNSRYVNGVVDRNDDAEDDSGWETVSHIEEQGSSFSPEGSDPSVNGFCQESNASLSGTDWEENGVPGKANSEISEVCSVGTKQSRKKVSSIVRLWKSSSGQINGENPKKISMEMINGRLSNGRMSNATTLSPERLSGEIGSSPRSLVQWSSPDSVNPPYIIRGTKGCIEWPRGTQKQSLKAKLLEARIESQKIQLKQVLKQKI